MRAIVILPRIIHSFPTTDGRIAHAITTTRKTPKGKARARAPRLSAEVRRPMVLDAAYAVFFERGYDGTSMEAIAERAGVTKPVIYDSFASKDELFAALVAREEERILADITAAIPAMVDDDLEQGVARGITAFLRSVADSPEVYRIIFLCEGGMNAVIAERIDRGRRRTVELLAPVLEDWLRRQGAGEPEKDGELLSYAVAGAAEGAARALLSSPKKFDPEAAGRTLARALVGGAQGL
jgi:AcrR family transcriptional regulator